MPTIPPLASGYVTDVAYPRHFHRETTPVWLTAVLAALGRRSPDITQPYTWLELGCGSGLNAVVAAAANPLGRFIGIDFNAQAISQARALAEAAGVRNAEFLPLSFEQALHAPEEAIPSCDFVVSHGVYSWIGPEHRLALRQLAAQRLKPGGVLYLAYMSHPGSSSLASAQRFMRMAAHGLPGSSAERARAGMDWLRRIAGAGAGYFVEHPHAAREIERAAQDDANYLAHEFLNDHWDALHVADVMADMADVQCEWSGSAVALDNIDAVSLPAATLPLLAELHRSGAAAAQIETFKDIARNQNQRRDLYQRAHPAGNRLSQEQHRAALLAQRVCLLPPAPVGAAPVLGQLTFDTRIGPIRIPAETVAPLLDALQAGPQSYRQLATLPSYANQPGFISQMLQVLAWAGWLHFLRPDAQAASATPADSKAAARLDAVLQQQEPPMGGPIRVCPAIGSAVPATVAPGQAARLQALLAPA